MKPFHDHFSTLATRYADFRPHYPPELFDYLATLVSRASLVWDCAAGNGQATIDLAKRFDKVVATDASADQIASATPHPGIDYRVALAEESGLPENSVGLVTVAQALHWFNLEKFWPEVKRVLTRSGVVAAWCYGIDKLEDPAVNVSRKFPRRNFAWKHVGLSLNCSAISAPGRQRIASSKPRAATRLNRFRFRSLALGAMRIRRV